MSESRNRTVLGADARMQGHLLLDNDAVIMGSFDGLLQVTGDLDLPATARIRGTVLAGTLRIAGHVQADLVAADAIDLLDGAVVSGHLYARQLAIGRDVELDGEIRVGTSAMAEAMQRIEAAHPQSVTGPNADMTDATGFEAPASEAAQAAADVEEEVEVEAAAAPAPPPAPRPKANVNVVPQSVQAVLGRRRPPKVLSFATAHREAPSTPTDTPDPDDHADAA